MALGSKIEWTETTWSPVTGCSKVSEGCKYRYAERMSRRLQAMGLEKYARGFQVSQHPSVLEEPLRWRKPRLVFVNSMSDLFHESVEPEFIKAAFEVMNRCPQHTFQVLTKRPELDLSGVDWVIAGGESGPSARPVDPDWVREIRGTCVRHEVLFFFKQWGGTNKKRAGRILDGGTWDEMPGREPFPVG